MLTIDRAGPGGSKDPGTQAESPEWVVGTQVFEPSLPASQSAHISKKLELGMESRIKTAFQYGMQASQVMS